MNGLLCDAGVGTLAQALALRPDLLAGYRALEAAVAAEPELDARLRDRCRARVATLCGGGAAPIDPGDSDDVVLEFVEQLVFDVHGMTDDLVARLGARLAPRAIVALAQAVVVWEGEHRLARTPPAGAPAPLRSYGLLAHAPGVLAAFMDLYGRLWQDGVVPQSIKEVARLRNARLTGCGYCRNVRFAGAREDGLTEDDVALIDDGYAGSALSARRKAAIALTDVVLGRRDLDDALAATLRREWSAPELVELAVTAALCHGFSKIAVALGQATADMPIMVVPSPTPPAAA